MHHVPHTTAEMRCGEMEAGRACMQGKNDTGTAYRPLGRIYSPFYQPCKAPLFLPCPSPRYIVHCISVMEPDLLASSSTQTPYPTHPCSCLAQSFPWSGCICMTDFPITQFQSISDPGLSLLILVHNHMTQAHVGLVVNQVERPMKQHWSSDPDGLQTED